MFYCALDWLVGGLRACLVGRVFAWLMCVWLTACLYDRLCVWSFVCVSDSSRVCLIVIFLIGGLLGWLNKRLNV